ncbi:MAG TPA: hypothetical protein VLM89_11320 [Phycisphaerae bacterium]|nr:hypothetical protein [Phycisphaerae bacterium]
MADAKPNSVPETPKGIDRDAFRIPDRIPDNLYAMRGLLILDLAVRLGVWGGALFWSCLIFSVLDFWPDGGLGKTAPELIGAWVCRLGLWVVLYNLIYVAELVVLRALIPTPREGRYQIRPGKPVDRQVIWACLIGLLVKARFEPPFPGFLVFHAASLPPMCWLMGRVFGPRCRSCNLTDAVILDPDRTVIGRNVVIGLNAVIAAHYQDRDAVVFSHTTIEDNVVIGGYAVIFGGSHLKAGCMIGAHAVVLPNTVVGPNEFWAGVPARKIRNLPPVDDAPGAQEGLG